MGGNVESARLQFDGVQGARYWSSTYFYSIYAWAFYSSWSHSQYSGGHFYDYMSYSGYAVAVREGDVASVPTPATVALLGLGLVGIGAARRKQAVSAAPGEPS
jgi:hypothetical protein